MDRKTVEHIANLARLSVGPQEIEIYSKQLTEILEHFKELTTIDTTSVQPLRTPSPLDINMRPDEVKKEFSAEDIISNAPEKRGHLYKVPTVV